MKKKVLILLGHYLPGTKIGGPLTSVINIVDSLSESYDFFIITSDRDFSDKLPYPNIKTNIWLPMQKCSVRYIRRNFFSLYQIVKNTKGLTPEIIYLNSLFDPLFSISIVASYKLGFMGKSRIIVAPRGELYNEALEFKKWKKKIFLGLVKILNLYKKVEWHATSEVERKFIADKLNISLNNIRVARPISKTSKPKEIFSSSNLLKVIFLGRISKDKNIPFAIDVLSKVKATIQFDIFGPIEDNDIWQKCLALIKALPANINANYKGIIEKEKVESLLASYDLFFMPTFAENYGHSIAESLSVGTPVLISDNTPWRDLSSKGFGWDLNLNDAEKFVQTIEKWALIPAEKKNELRKQRNKNASSILGDPLILQENIDLFK